MPDAPAVPTAPAAAEKLLRHLLDTTARRDYDAFILAGTDRFQAGISREMFYRVSDQVATRLRAGHVTEFLTEIKQCEHAVYLWKLSFRDGGNQFVARLVMTGENKVAGFMLN